MDLISGADCLQNWATRCPQTNPDPGESEERERGWADIMRKCLGKTVGGEERGRVRESEEGGDNEREGQNRMGKDKKRKSKMALYGLVD